MTDDNSQWVVISDLDGTMLNHDTYAVNGAVDAIKILQNNKIPIVFNTSKTYAETLIIREQLGVSDPFIVENGSCIYMPVKQFTKPSSSAYLRDDYWAIEMGKSSKYIQDILSSISTPPSSYTRLSQCTIDQAIKLTGLSHDNANLAINREFSEPVIWLSVESHLSDFKRQLQQHDLTTLTGGRFLHVLGGCDKGRATKKFIEFYDKTVKTVILGDSENDADMLSLADISIIVNSPSNNKLLKIINPTIRSENYAPDGWSEAIHKALPDLFYI